jgi:hypothetical protein
LGVFRDRFPDFRKFRNSEIRDILHFGISGFRESRPWKPLFSQKPLCAAGTPGDFGNLGFRGFQDLGDTFTQIVKISGKFRKTGNSEHFFALFFSVLRVSVYSVAKSEKPQNKMTLWNLLLFPNFPGCFQGFQGLST